MTAILRTGLRFGLVGLANTAVGLGTILAMLAAGLGDYAANMCGYAVGLVVSFVLNRTWTFGIRGAVAWREALAFLLAVAVSYLVNLGLLGTMRALGYRESLIGQAVAVLGYSACFFVLSGCFVFHKRTPKVNVHG